MTYFLAYLTTLLFLVTACVYLYYFVNNEKRFSNTGKWLLVFAVLANVAYLLSLAYTFKRLPLSSLSEAFDFMAIMLAVSYFLIETITRNRNTGFLILILVFLFKLVSLIFMKHTSQVNPILSNWYFILHVIPATLGYAALAISMIYGILYLTLYRELHLKRFGPFYKRLPSLEGMESLVRTSLKLGFILLTVGIVAGFPLSKATFMTFFKWDPKLVVVISIWFLYLVVIILGSLFSWKGKRYAISSIVGFSLLIVALAFVEIFMKSFHRFV